MATIIGTDGDDSLVGTDNPDTIEGLAGNDTLLGLDDDDLLDGGQDSDLLDGGPGNDTILGREGIDTAVYAENADKVRVDLSSGTAEEFGDGGTVIFTDSLIEIENVIGSAFNDTITGDSGSNDVDGGGGNDLLNAGTPVRPAIRLPAATAMTR